MPSHRIGGFIVVGLAVCLGLVLWARAGDLNPPAGPVAPTMKTLDQLSTEHAQLASSIAAIGGGGGIKGIIRGVVTFNDNEWEVSQAFNPAIDPTRSLVVLDNAVMTMNVSTNVTNAAKARNGACLVNLTSSSITIRIDQTGPIAVHRVSYQIIEYN
jgi:hypothetical protein